MLFAVQLLIVLQALYVGSRYGTLALGAISGIATVNFDRSGTTVIGKYLLNHSFMMPGLVSVAVSTIAGLILSTLMFR